MSYQICPMTLEDYDTVYALWEKTEGIGLSEADSKKNINIYLKRNPGLSFVAFFQDTMIGAVLSGHDGRRGFIHHLVVDREHQKQHIGGALVEKCLKALKKNGIQKCHIFVYRDNESGKAFWEHIGWKLRQELDIMSHDLL